MGSYFSLTLQQNSCLNWFLFLFAKLNWRKLNAWWSDRQLVVTHNWNLKQEQIQWRFKFCWNCSITDSLWTNFYPCAESTEAFWEFMHDQITKNTNTFGCLTHLQFCPTKLHNKYPRYRSKSILFHCGVWI